MRNLTLNLRAFARVAVDEVLIHLTGGAIVADEQAVIPPCAASGRRPHPAADGVDREGNPQPTGHHLCRRHLNRLRRVLAEIERGAQTLAFDPEHPGRWPAVPSTAMRWNYATGGNTAGGAPAFEQTPANLDPLVATDRRHGRGDREEDDDAHAAADSVSVFAMLNSYAAQIRQQRRFANPIRVEVRRLPGRPGPVCGLPCTHDSCQAMARWRVIHQPLTIGTEVLLLTRQLEWIASQDPDWVAKFWVDMTGLLDTVEKANRTSRPRPLPGRCPALVDGKECGGRLWPVKPVHTVGEWTGSAPSAVRCGSCKTRWEGASALARLALITEKRTKGTPA